MFKHREVQLQGSASQCDSSQKRIYPHFTWPPWKLVFGWFSQLPKPPLQVPWLDIIPQILQCTAGAGLVAKKREGGCSLKYPDIFLASEEGCVCNIAFMNLIEAEDRYDSQYGVGT